MNIEKTVLFRMKTDIQQRGCESNWSTMNLETYNQSASNDKKWDYWEQYQLTICLNYF